MQIRLSKKEIEEIAIKKGELTKDYEVDKIEWSSTGGNYVALFLQIVLICAF